MKGAVAVLLVLAVARLAVEPGQAMTCGEIQNTLAPCLLFVTGRQPEPSELCCSGVKKLESSMSSTEDKRSACKCLKDVLSKFPGVNDGNVSALPGKCNAPLPFPISVSMDCDRIQ